MPLSQPSLPGGGSTAGVRVPRRPRPSTGELGVALSQLLDDLVGGEPIFTLAQRRPNWVVAVEDDVLLVETAKTRSGDDEPQPVPVEWLDQAVATLERAGRLTRADLGRGQYRSAFIFALLARLPGVTATVDPRELQFERSIARVGEEGAPRSEIEPADGG